MTSMWMRTNTFRGRSGKGGGVGGLEGEEADEEKVAEANDENASTKVAVSCS